MRGLSRALSLLRCPVCGAAFSQISEKSIACDQRHSFDFAKEGHLHLLPAGHGKGKLEGDSKEMLQARRRFFAAGHYDAVAAAVAEFVVGACVGISSPVILDAGCGTGHYSSALLRRLSTATVIGTDLSKEAVRLAAKSEPGALFAVADSARLPVADGCVDVVVDVFAPRSADFGRVVKAGGSVVVAVPQPDHLNELVAISGLGIAPHKEERVTEQLAPWFDPDDDTDGGASGGVVRAALPLHESALVDLLTMTPHHHHLGDDDLLPAALTVTLSVKLLRFRRR